MKPIHTALLALLAMSALPAAATDAHQAAPTGSGTAAASAVSQQAWSEAEVRKVDREAGKVTLRHGPLPHLGMPTGMTMVFRVNESKLLEGLQNGDKIRFVADKVNGAYTVMAVQK